MKKKHKTKRKEPEVKESYIKKISKIERDYFKKYPNGRSRTIKEIRQEIERK
ncbi:MAG: hypothetical protein Q7S21_06510 [archaeon]|nr:hypothetical protein [archaeon]